MRLLDKGFTLPELLLSTAILAFVLTGLLLLFVNCSFLNEGNRNLTIAMTHAQYIMEELRNEDTLQDVKTMIDDQTFASLQDLPNENISVCCYNPPWVDADTSCLGVCPAGVDPLGVSVVVTWQDRGTRNRQVGLQTLMTDY